MQKPSKTAFADMKKNFEQLSYRHSYAETFTHFLDYSLYMLDPSKNPEPAAYLNTIYKENEEEIMQAMFWNWIDASDNDGEGFSDVLGDLFMEFVSHGRNGQFFTPQPICDMMAALTIDNNKSSFYDPACGSGRTLLASAKINRRGFFVGADNDITCCKMTALNMIINTMAGEVAHMNSLSLEYYSSFHIQARNINGVMIPLYFVSNDRTASNIFK